MKQAGRMGGVLVLVAVAIGVHHALDLGHVLSLSALRERQADWQQWTAAHPWQAAGAFFAAYVGVTAASLPGAAVMTLAAGALFGLARGTAIVSFASSVGATLAFLASRWALGGWVQARFADRLSTFNAGVRQDGGFYLFTLRLVPAVPFFVINLAMGLTPIRAWTFYWVSQVGMLAGTLVYVNAGTRLATINDLRGLASPALLASLAAVGLLPLAARQALDAIRSAGRGHRWPRPRRFDRDLVVIGGGSAGLVTAYIGAALKARVTLVERHRLGGDCLHTGCVPSKALIRTARFVAEARRADELGLAPLDVRVDFAEVMARVRRVIAQVEPHDSAARYRGLGVDVAEGSARIVSPWEVAVTQADGQVRRLTTRRIVVAAGARPILPDIPGIDEVEAFTSDTIWSLTALPRRLLVIGGGPIGSELSQAFARLGAQVTLVDASARLLPREDADVADVVAARFRVEGIDVRTGHVPRRFVREGAARWLVAEHEGREVRIDFDVVLVAVGRAANLQGYGLEDVGVDVGRTVIVDAWQRTSVPSIYAAGDVAGPYQFTHTAAHQAWYAAVNALIAPFWRFRVDWRAIPAVTFVDPEVARVGLGEREARERGIAHEVTRYALDELDRAIADESAHGFIKVLTPPGSDRILGVTIVGDHAGELIAEWTLAMQQGIGLNRILGTVHAYPTWPEASKAAAGRWKQAHAPRRLLAWVERVHAWRRGAAQEAA